MHDVRDALQVLDLEIDNISAALRWALERAPTEALRLASHLGDYWGRRGASDGLSWLERALQAAGDQAPPSDRARAQRWRARMLAGRWQYEAARSAAEEMLSLYQEMNDRSGEALALDEIAALVAQFGGPEEARACAEAACDGARAVDDERLLGVALDRLSWFLPKPERAAVFQEAVELLTRAGDHERLNGAYASAAYLALKEDAVDEAIAMLRLAEHVAKRIDNPFSAMIRCGNFGLAHLSPGDIAAARRAFEDQLRLCLRHAYIYGAPKVSSG